ncbi:MAG: hypothetical protein ACM3S1_05080 [Hyphomicrobiales bacterium]
MSRATSGLQRDLNLVRRRAWLFIPFFFLGLLVALAFGSVAGEANAVASMQLETVVQDLVAGGDRGLRIFEAQSMTTDERFKQEVIDEIGDPNFDYARFSISLAPISVADGVSRGVLTVSVKDDDKAKAEAYRAAWVSVFTREYTSLDGLFRTRFLDKKQAVADMADKNYTDAYNALKAQHPELPLDELVIPASQGGSPLREELSRQDAQLQAELAEVQGALDSGNINGALASAVLGTPVTDAQAQAALEGRRASLQAAIDSVAEQRANLSDTGLPPDVRAEVANLRSLAEIRAESYVRLNNARVAVTGAQSDVETSYSFSGGVAGTVIGRVAVVIAITVVFGLIAIYGLEWLMQVREGVADSEREPA